MRGSRAAVLATAVLASGCGSKPPPTQTLVETPAPLPKPPSDTIRLLVLDANYNRPLVGFQIRLEGPSGDAEERHVRSDGNGYVVFDKLPPGTYRFFREDQQFSDEPLVTLVLDGTEGKHVDVSITGHVDSTCCPPYGAPPARRRLV
jgi:hypothetical protein